MIAQPIPKAKIRVLVIDDSAIVRKILSEAIASQPDMEVVGTAPDPYVARDKILALKPDVLTLDIEMPRMDGLTFLKKVMLHHPVPTIVISSLSQSSTQAALDAMRYGAVDVLGKPAGPYSVGDLRNSLASRIRAAAASRRPAPQPVRVVPDFAVPPPTAPGGHPPAPHAFTPVAAQPAIQTVEKLLAPAAFTYHPDTLLAIGASTGGTVAIQDILQRFPADIPCTVITQHIPAGFSLAFANRLNQLCAMEVREAVDGDMLHPGLVLVAPGDFHMMVRRAGGGYRVELQQGPQVCYQRPSVDVMFASVAQAAAGRAIGVLLTGMGTDGAKGLLGMRRAGAPTIGQDEASCIVYGMPREAARLGAVETVASLHDIPAIVAATLRRNAGSPRSTNVHLSDPHTQPVLHKGATQ